MISTVPLAAQTVLGQVTEEGTLQPLQGVFVVLESEDGARSRGVLTNAEGHFHLKASAGRFRLVAELIGYGSSVSPLFDLAVQERVRQDLTLGVQAISLEGIAVRVKGRCQRRPTGGAATARLWEEARKALEVARWSQEQGVLEFRTVRFERELDGSTLEVVKEQRTVARGYHRTSPYESLPAIRLAADGYVQTAADRGISYYGPDADVLLSDEFMDTHCFEVVEGPRDEPDLLGLEFRPVPARDLPDIRGVLWLNRGSAELRRIDFQYVNLPGARREWARVGGRVEFERLPTGVWMIRRWRIRMPLEIAQDRQGHATIRRLAEQGAEVESVRTVGGETLVSSSAATLYGTAALADGRPLRGAIIELPALERRAVSGDDGAFRLTGLPPATYAVRIGHPDLRLLGLPEEERRVELIPRRSTRLNVALPLTPERAALLCDASAGGDEWVLLYGRVTRDSAAMPGALVRLEADGAVQRLMADSAGSYRACVRRPSSLRLSAAPPSAAGAALDATALAAADVPVAGPGFLRADVEVREPRAAEVGASSRVTSHVVGTVREHGTDAPLPGALVSLRDATGAVRGSGVSGEEGAFRIAHPGGVDREFTVEVEHIAYGLVRSELDFPNGQHLTLGVQLSARPIELAPIVVRERRRGLLAEVGYYDRRDHSMGVAIDRDQIERRTPSQLTDLVRGMVGWRVIPMNRSGTKWDIRSSTAGRIDGRDCQPSIWIDGIRVRSGGEPLIDPQTRSIVDRTLSEIASPDDLEAMELFRHPSEIPPRFGGLDAACGVVLIWRRSANGQ